MLKDYIRALQTSFTTVTGLRDVLIKIFNKIDSDMNTVTSADITTTHTVSTTYLNGLRINGKVVECDLNVTGVTGSGTTLIGTIPEEYRPSKPFIIPIVVSGSFGYASIDENGNISTTLTLNNASIRVHTSWIID